MASPTPPTQLSSQFTLTPLSPYPRAFGWVALMPKKSPIIKEERSIFPR
ncbi:MAG: hypothetical protein ACFFAG_18205 [Promethearchaeota archaeon]